MEMYQKLKILIFTIFVVCLATGVSFSENFSVVEGTIQGVNCTIHHSKCPLDISDPHIALEQDFVFVTAEGDYFFLPNVSRLIKVKCLNREVRITGDKKAEVIIVSKIDLKDKEEYNVMWDWGKMNAINEISF